MIHFLSLNIWYVIYVVIWIKYWNLKLPHHCIQFLFPICIVSQLFWNRVCSSWCKQALIVLLHWMANFKCILCIFNCNCVTVFVFKYSFPHSILYLYFKYILMYLCPPLPPCSPPLPDSWEPPSLRTWSSIITLTLLRKRLYFLHQLRKFNLPQEKQLYSAIIKTLLCSSITVWFGSVQLPKETSEDYNGQSGQLRGLSVPFCPASKNFTPPEWGKGLRKSLWTPHTQLTLSLNCCPQAGTTEHWAPKQPDTRTVFTPRSYPTWTSHNIPQYCTSVNNSSNLHLWDKCTFTVLSMVIFIFCIFLFYLVIHNFCLLSSLFMFFINLILCCLHYVCTFCIGSS